MAPDEERQRHAGPDRGGHEQAYWWQCPAAEGHAWEAAPQHRLKSPDGEGCPFCRNLRASVINRLDIHHPDVAAQWHPELNGTVTPADVVSSTQDRYWWRCPQGPDHEWLAQVHLRTGKGHGCPFCSNRRLSVTNSVAARFPDHAYLFHPTRNDAPADQTMANTEVKVWWQCPVAEDHEWRESAGRVAGNSWAHGRTGCPACAGLQVSTTNRLSNYPELAAELHPSKNGSLTADDVVAGTGRKLWWLCRSCGHEWDAIGAGRLKGHGCPMCQRFHRSVLEVALGYELTTIWPDLNLDQDKVVVAGKVRHVDLIVPSARLIIEVDGAYRHAESTAKDTAKSAALRDAGWHVIRVGEEPLAATHPHDVVVPNDSPVKVVADAVLARAAELGWADEVSTATYQDELEPRRLAAALGEMQRRRPGKRLVIPGTPKGPTRADRWQRNYDALLRFVIEHGHSRPVDDTVYDDLPLGGWVSQQRSRHRRGVLQPERATRLAALPGWTWDVSESEWEHGLARLIAYVAEHGTSRVPVAHRDDDGYPLGTWVRTHRQPGHRKPLIGNQQRRLAELPDWTFDNLQHVAWENGLAALRAFSAEHGHVRLSRKVRGTDADLIGFVARHRASYRRGELPADRVAALESVPGCS